MTWRPLHETKAHRFNGLRRVIMSGYYREGGQLRAKVGEAEWVEPDGHGSAWYWADGTKVINPMSFQDFPDFPIPEENTHHVVGRSVPQNRKEKADANEV